MTFTTIGPHLDISGGNPLHVVLLCSRATSVNASESFCHTNRSSALGRKVAAKVAGRTLQPKQPRCIYLTEKRSGTPERIRTSDLLLRRLPLSIKINNLC